MTAPIKALEALSTDDILCMIVEGYDPKHLSQLPRLHRLARKIEAVHRDHPEVPKGLTLVLKRLEKRLQAHVESEEAHVFSAMKGDQPPRQDTPISQMNVEHEEIDDLITEIRRLTRNYAAPANACRSWQRLYFTLNEFDHSLTRQIQLERDVLYPRYQF